MVHDEVELAAATWKWKTGGGHKGHNGLRSIIQLGNADFLRIRIGVGRPDNENIALADFLLSKLNSSVMQKIHSCFPDILSSLQEKIPLIT